MATAAVHAEPATSAASSSKRSTADEHKRSTDAPFAFRGIPLGITLDEFRAGSTVRATPVGSVPVCETDVLAGALGMSLKTSESLTVACRWAHRSADRWQVSQAVVDGAPAQDHVLRFARVDGQTALRLYEISFVIDEVTAGDLRDALADRYGPPRLVDEEHLGDGQRGSRVRLGKRGELDHLVLFAGHPQRHADLSAERSGRVGEVAGAPMAGEQPRGGLMSAECVPTPICPIFTPAEEFP